MHRGNQISNNLFEEIRHSDPQRDSKGGMAAAVYFDDMLSGNRVINNSFKNCETGVLLGGGRHHTVQGNTFHNVGDLSGGQCIWIDARGLNGPGGPTKNPKCRFNGSFHKELEALHFTQPPWSTHYPSIPPIFAEGAAGPYSGCEPANNRILDNTCTGDAGSPGRFLVTSPDLGHPISIMEGWGDSFGGNSNGTGCVMYSEDTLSDPLVTAAQIPRSISDRAPDFKADDEQAFTVERSVHVYAAGARHVCKADDDEALYSRLGRVPYPAQHTGLARSSDEFRHVSFCTDFHESENVSSANNAWASGFDTPRPYLWHVQPNGSRTAPPTGLRSAVPLGGLGSGSFEVRGDGSFHEWTLENASPAGQAKLPPAALQDALFGVWVGGTAGTKFAKAVRTSPPPGIPAIESLGYNGLYPMSRLRLADAALPVEAELSMLSSFRIFDLNASNAPSASFVLNVHNPRSAAVDVALMLLLPFGRNAETDRSGGDMSNAATAPNATMCLKRCAATTGCRAWAFNDGKRMCFLKDKVGPTVWCPGVISGSMHTWSQASSGVLSVTRACSGPLDSQCGGIAIGDGSGSGRIVSSTSASDAGSIWSDFEADGKLGASPLDPSASHGAFAARATVPAGANISIPLTLGWYFPQRTWTGEDATSTSVEATVLEGNAYAALTHSAAEAVAQAQAQLAPTLDAIQSLHNVLVVEPTWPTWLGENLVNSLSHARNAQLNSEGEWRQFESFACNNVDSIHNDFQRSRFYLWFFPASVKSKLRGWAKAQCGVGKSTLVTNATAAANGGCTEADDGMLQEQLACGCASPTQSLRDGFGCGRRMGDVTSNYLHYLLGYTRQTGDSALAAELHPTVQRAARWMMRNAAVDGLPNQLQMSYDQYELQEYSHTAYNALLYLSAMKSCVKLASLQRDEALGTECGAAFTRGSTAFSQQFWSDEKTGGYFRAVVDRSGSPAWIMGDSLFGTVVSAELGLGDLFSNGSSRARSHLESELKYLASDYGLRTMSDTANASHCPLPKRICTCKNATMNGPLTLCDTAWGQLDGTWTSAMLRLSRSEGAAERLLAPGTPLYQQLESGYNDVLRDVWNPHAYVGTTGPLASLPLSNSHYGMHMIQWWVVVSISGQNYDGVDRILSFEPSAIPDASGETRLPVFVNQSACVLSMSSAGFKLRLVYGQALHLTRLCATDPGGKPVCAKAPVALEKRDDSVSWPVQPRSEDESSSADQLLI